MTIRRTISAILLLIILALEACSHKPAPWIVQYPYDYKPMYQTELVYVDSDSWHCVNGRIIWAISGIVAGDSGDVWAVKDWGKILHSKDGRHFEKIAAPHVHQLNEIKCCGNEVWAMGCSGSIIHYKDGKFTVEGKGLTDKDIWEFWMNETGSEGWAVGNQGLVLHYAGGKWSVVTIDIDEFIHDIWMKPDGSEGWAVGNAGTILYYKDGQWVVKNHGLSSGPYHSPDLMNVWMNPTGTEGWAMGGEGDILHYKAGGWTTEQHSGSFEYTNIRMRPDGSDGWATGSDGKVTHYRKGKWSSPETFNTNYFKSLIADSPDYWLAGSDNLLHSSDNAHFSFFEESLSHGTECGSGRNKILWAGCWNDKILRISAVPGAYYPTLSQIRYRLFPTDSPDSIAIDFQLAVKGGDISKYLPVTFSLQAKQNEDAPYQDISCTFMRQDSVMNPGTWSAKFSLQPFHFDLTHANPLRLLLTLRVAGGNESVFYDLKEGGNDFLTLKRSD